MGGKKEREQLQLANEVPVLLLAADVLCWSVYLLESTDQCLRLFIYTWHQPKGLERCAILAPNMRTCRASEYKVFLKQMTWGICPDIPRHSISQRDTTSAIWPNLQSPAAVVHYIALNPRSRLVTPRTLDQDLAVAPRQFRACSATKIVQVPVLLGKGPASGSCVIEPLRQTVEILSKLRRFVISSILE